MSDLGIIQADGPDAANFLHGQFSQDVNSQTAQEARLAAYCSAKGRMLASLLNVRPHAEQVLMLTDAQVLPGLLKRLSMFVMRSKVKLTDASGSLSVVGLLGSAVAAKLGDVAGVAPWGVAAARNGHLIRLPDVLGVQRWYWLGPQEEAQALLAELPAVAADAWKWLDVMSGIPRIEASTVDQFVPQMINFELIGGVNFKKGCYPGQEVVARSQYRGTTKRRALIAHGTTPLSPGQEIFSLADPGQPAGMVINSATVNGVHSALLELKLSALTSELRAGAADGPALTLGALPYDLPQAEEAA